MLSLGIAMAHAFAVPPNAVPEQQVLQLLAGVPGIPIDESAGVPLTEWLRA
jgi:hypothetical protein